MMKAYIERPISEKPEKEGYYTVIDPDSSAGADSFYFLDDEWFDTYPEAVDEHADPIDVDGLLWLQPVELPQGNTDVLVKSLQRIIEPIKYMRDELKEGEQLNGHYAIQLSNDPEYLKGIAREALASYNTGKGQNQ